MINEVVLEGIVVREPWKFMDDLFFRLVIYRDSDLPAKKLDLERGVGDRLSRILWELRQPVDMSRVKRRQAPGMGSVPYLEGYDDIDRANRIFGFTWSFDLVGEPVIVRWQKKC